MGIWLAWDSPAQDGETSDNAIVSPAELSAALDGREVVVGGSKWRLEPYGVWDDSGRRWVQLALKGHPEYLLTIRLAAGAGAQHAVLAVSSWLAGGPGDVVNVA